MAAFSFLMPTGDDVWTQDAIDGLVGQEVPLKVLDAPTGLRFKVSSARRSNGGITMTGRVVG